MYLDHGTPLADAQTRRQAALETIRASPAAISQKRSAWNSFCE